MMMRVMAALLMPNIKLVMYSEYESANMPLGGYQPAPTGLLEVGRQQYMNPKWLRKLHDNRLVKIFYEGLPYLPSYPGLKYVVIFMRRNPEEIKLSLQRTEEYFKRWEEISANPREIPDRLGMGFDMFQEYNEADIHHVLSIVRARRDIILIEVQFEHFCMNTRAELTKLVKLLPVDISETKIIAALDEVNSKHRRSRCA